MPSDILEFSDPAEYSRVHPIHMAIYARNGIGKTTFAGGAAKDGMNVTVLDCSDSGAITLRNHPKDKLRIIRITSILHYLDVIEKCIREAKNIDVLVPDTLTGLQSLAIKEVKGKRSFQMNKHKWGVAAAKMVECIAETRNFPGDVLYLVQEKKSKGEDDDGPDTIESALTPSVKGYLSSCVDWVGHLVIEEIQNDTGDMIPTRFLDFRIGEFVEAKDRAGLFPKRIKNPSYRAVRKRINDQLQPTEGTTT